MILVFISNMISYHVEQVGLNSRQMNNIHKILFKRPWQPFWQVIIAKRLPRYVNSGSCKLNRVECIFFRECCNISYLKSLSVGPFSTHCDSIQMIDSTLHFPGYSPNCRKKKVLITHGDELQQNILTQREFITIKVFFFFN